MLPTLGIVFALLAGFIAVEVWNNFDKAKGAVATEARFVLSLAVVPLAGTFPEEQKTRSDQPPHRGSGELRMARDGATASDPLAFTHGVDLGTA